MRALALIPRLLLVWVACLAGPSHAATVAVVVSEDDGAYREVAEAIETRLREARIECERMTVGKLNGRLDLPARRLVIAVGVEAGNQVLARKPALPVLATLVTRAWYEDAQRVSGLPVARFSAIWLDQPIERHLRLVRHALPGVKHVGVLLSARSDVPLAKIEPAAKALGFDLEHEHVDSAQRIIPALDSLLARSDVLLALPDPLIYNSYTAQNVLLTTYRHRDPVVAYSQAYVKAGALLGLFVTPRQIGQQAGETAALIASSESWALPAAGPVGDFEVAVNLHVARSLGIDVPDRATLRRAIEATRRGSGDKP